MTALDREVVDAVVEPDHVGPSAEFRTALDRWPGTYYWSRREGPNRLVLIRPLRSPRRERLWLHVLLFIITFGTVWVAGAALLGVRPPAIWSLMPSVTAAAVGDWLGSAMPGLGFAVALMGVLLLHELGHYVVARRYHIDASLPYFLPAPHVINFIGTFGAFIRLRSPIIDRRQLFDVGAAGPWAGLVVSLVVLAIGLHNSTPLHDVTGQSHQLIYLLNNPFFLGDSVLMNWARIAIVGDHTIELHPLALAGWFGLFVTMLNLLPLGQLDGGHIVYSMIGKHQAKVGYLMWYALIYLGFWFKGWWLWALLILILGRGRLAHPSVMDPYRPIPASRIPLGVATAILFFVTFSPDPLPSIL